MKKIINIFLIINLLILPTFFYKTQKAEALFGVGDVVFDPGNFVKNAMTAVTTVKQLALSMQDYLKEFVLDPIAYFAAKSLIQGMTESSISWINSGFSGAPAFVTDVDFFVRQLEEDVTLQWDSEVAGRLGASPSAGVIRSALIMQHIAAPAPAYLDMNIEGTAYTWGWDEWSNATYKGNSPVSSFINESQRLDAEIERKQTIEQTKWNWSDGFLAMQDCPNGPASPCQTITPGQTISQAISKTLGSGQDALVAADEIDEIIMGVLTTLSEQVLGSTGLFAANTPGPSGTSLLQALGTIQTVNVSTLTGLLNGINADIVAENAFVGKNNQVLTASNSVMNTLLSLKACYIAKGASVVAVNNEIASTAVAQTNISNDTTLANNNINNLNSLKAVIRSPSATTAQLNSVTLNYQNLQSSGSLYNAIELSDAEDYREQLVIRNNQLLQQLNQCNNPWLP